MKKYTNITEKILDQNTNSLFLSSYYWLDIQVRKWAWRPAQFTLTLPYHHFSTLLWKYIFLGNWTQIFIPSYWSHQPIHCVSTPISEYLTLHTQFSSPSEVLPAFLAFLIQGWKSFNSLYAHIFALLISSCLNPH